MSIQKISKEATKDKYIYLYIYIYIFTYIDNLVI
jgi:hypothetical protein